MTQVSERALTTDTKVFGFWIYLMTDLVIFSALFATYVTMRNNTFGGPSGRELFHMSSALAETLLLLTSSFTCALANLSVFQGHKKWAIAWFLCTFALGVSFLGLELSEFSKLAHEGNSWRRSGFLSSYFALVGTHGFHISVGLLWMAVNMFRIGLRGMTQATVSTTFRLVLFWHFLDIVWIFIFTVVYAMGHLLP